MKQIEIVIAPTGHLTVNAEGFKGTACEEATAFLMRCLGEITTRQRKPEYHQRARRAATQQVGR